METPLTAREFLKRYHLPQLVRISSASGEQPDKEEVICGESTSSCDNNERINNNNNKCSVRVVSPNQSNTSISSSFVVVGDQSTSSVSQNNQRQYEKSDWTYCAASSISTRGQANTLSLIGGRSEQNLNFRNINNDNVAASRGLFRSSNQIEQQDDEFEDNDNHLDYSEHRSFRSIPVWSSSTINNKHTTTISSCSKQLPGEREQSSEHNNSNGNNRNQLARNSNNSNNNKKSVEFEQAYSVSGGNGSGNSSSSSSKWRNALQSIRLTPPSKRPALSKLQLNQPFLLYKAYKKLELCAYVIDLKNELNEKSGDPIYFPQNYPGK